MYLLGEESGYPSSLSAAPPLSLSLLRSNLINSYPLLAGDIEESIGKITEALTNIVGLLSQLLPHEVEAEPRRGFGLSS